MKKQQTLLFNTIFIVVAIIGSIYFIPSMFYILIKSLNIIKNDSLLKLIATFLYGLILFFIFHKQIINEFKIFKNNLKENINISLKYWLLGFIGMIFSNIIINFIILKGEIAANEELNRQILLESPLFTSISAIIIAPFIEEIIFRKSFRPLFKNMILYATISGILFGLMHALTNINSIIQLLYIIPYGILGFNFAIIYYKTKTIFSPILVHMLHNLLIVTLVLLML